MLRFVIRSEGSRRQITAGLVVALSLLAATPALAKKKPAAAAPAAPEPAAAEPTGDPKLAAPAPDTFGRVHFGPSSGADLGRVSVKGAPGENVKVFLEGRYFGDAPITIYSVPKGDYIVEGTFPDGKSVSRAISVSENEEAVADFTGAHKLGEKPAAPMFQTSEISQQRLTMTKAFVIGGGVALVVGVTFGILEIMKESDYRNSTGDQATLDNLASTGKTYALLANLGYALAFVGVVGAAICAYPMFIKPNAEKKTIALATRPVFVVVPAGSGAAASMSLRF
jgi:hypothetical protein